MKRLAILLPLLLACEEPKTGDACEKSSQCPDANHCLAKLCVEEGSKHLVDITLVGTDHDDLACAIDSSVNGFGCSHDYKQQIVSKTAARDDAKRLQPVTTKKGITLLAASIWNQPAIASKLDKAEKGTRFTASCQVIVRGSVEKARVRWKRGEEWMAATHVPVVVADSCTIGK